MIGKSPLSDKFGVEIAGVDLTRGLSEAQAREIIAALHEHQVILIKGATLEPPQFESFARHFGEPIPHVLDHFRIPDLPGVMRLSNLPDRPNRNFNGAAFWHTDQSYEGEPSSATTLHAVMVPKTGGGTRIADMFTAYDDLPDAMKRRIGGLAVLHIYGNRDGGRDGEFEASPLRNAEQAARVPPVHHALVRPHPVTGRKALYAVGGTSRGIVGWPEDEALDLLRELKAHAVQEQYVHTQFYQVGDTAVWDTSSTLHAAMPQGEATGPDDSRLMLRASLRGLPPLLRKAG